VGGGRGGKGESMSVKRKTGKTGRPVKVPGEKDTKEKIFDAAVDLFAEKGYDRVSIRDIGRAVGITEAAVYRHYSSKDDILKAIFTYIESRIYPQAAEGSVDALVEALPLQQILESTPRFMMADRYLAKITRIMLIEMYHNEKIGNYVRRELLERPVDETEALFRKLMEKGKVKPCDPRMLSTLYISLLVYWYFEAFILDYSEPMNFERSGEIVNGRIRSFVDMFRAE
jgi:AcrR family transcriptional regulator